MKWLIDWLQPMINALGEHGGIDKQYAAEKARADAERWDKQNMERVCVCNRKICTYDADVGCGPKPRDDPADSVFNRGTVMTSQGQPYYVGEGNIIVQSPLDPDIWVEIENAGMGKVVRQGRVFDGTTSKVEPEAQSAPDRVHGDRFSGLEIE